MRAGRPSASAAVALGRGMAAVLSLALRPAPPASAAGFDDLDRLVPLLVNAGAAGLAWRTIKDTPARSHPAVAPLRELFEWQLLRSRIADTELATLAQKAGDAGVEPLLGKGWAVARLYPEIGLRTFGDFDIYLDPADHQRLVQVLHHRHVGAAAHEAQVRILENLDAVAPVVLPRLAGNLGIREAVRQRVPGRRQLGDAHARGHLQIGRAHV